MSRYDMGLILDDPAVLTPAYRNYQWAEQWLFIHGLKRPPRMAGITPAEFAKDRLRVIVRKDRQTAPTHGWVYKGRINPRPFRRVYRWERRQ